MYKADRRSPCWPSAIPAPPHAHNQSAKPASPGAKPRRADDPDGCSGSSHTGSYDNSLFSHLLLTLGRLEVLQHDNRPRPFTHGDDDRLVVDDDPHVLSIMADSDNEHLRTHTVAPSRRCRPGNRQAACPTAVCLRSSVWVSAARRPLLEPRCVSSTY